MGRFDRLPGIGEENTRRRNVLVGSMYALAGCVALGTITADDDGPDNDTENDNDDEESINDTADDDDDPTGVELLARETYSDPGAMTAVAPSGDHVAFGLHPVDRFIGYDVNTDSLTSVDGSVGEPAQMELRDDGYVTVGWWEADTLGGINISESNGPEWTAEYQHLGGIDLTADHSTIAAISGGSFESGPGRVGVFSEGGETIWDESLDDAMPTHVAIAPEGEYVAVGTTEYWDETAEDYRGSIGVRLLDGDIGDEQWRYELEDVDEEPTRVAVHEETGLFIAATLDNRITGLDLEGDVLWETEGSAGVNVLSGDGSAVVVRREGEIHSLDATNGEEQWHSDADLGPVGFAWINRDGSRVAVTARSQDERRLYIIEEGKEVWTDERNNHVSMDISGDGMIWSLIESDGDTDEAHIEVYRDYGA